MSTWLPAVLSLVGALAGVGLANYLTRVSKRSDERRRRLEDATRAVVLAQAAAKFTYRVAVDRPPTVRSADVDELERRVWLSGVERYFTRLREAREAAASLIVDGLDLTEYTQSDEALQQNLDHVSAILRARLDESR